MSKYLPMEHTPQLVKVATCMDRPITKTNDRSVRQEHIVLESCIRGTHHHLTKVDETMLHMEKIPNSPVRNKCVCLAASYIEEHFRGLSQGIEAMDRMEGAHAQLYGEVAQLGLDPATIWRVESSPLGVSGCAGKRGVVRVLECHRDEICDVIKISLVSFKK
jgi:hypothetical protein